MLQQQWFLIEQKIINYLLFIMIISLLSDIADTYTSSDSVKNVRPFINLSVKLFQCKSNKWPIIINIIVEIIGKVFCRLYLVQSMTSRSIQTTIHSNRFAQLFKHQIKSLYFPTDN